MEEKSILMNKVSIVIPVYNQEVYLRRSLSSAISQTYSNLEIICVNDGSTDKSSEILEEYKKEDMRIIILNQQNSGLVHAVSQGVKKSTGDYICFLDSDDYLDQNYVQDAVSEIGDNDFVAFSHYIDDGKKINENLVDEDSQLDKEMLEIVCNNLVWDIDRRKVSRRILNSRWNKIYRSECIKAFIDLYDDCKYISFGEDTLFTYFLLKNSTSAVVRKKTIGYYYNTSNINSMMSEGKTEAHLKKAKLSFEKYNGMMGMYNDKNAQPYAMYFFLIESLFQRLEHSNLYREFDDMYNKLKKDSDYQRALDFLSKYSTGKQKLVFFLRHYSSNPRIYRWLFETAKKVSI